MNFDHSRRTSADQSVTGDPGAGPSNGASKSGDGETHDMRGLGGPVASSKKIEASRNNAKKSTGPKSRRGKSHSRLNALKHGAFAVQRLLPGENAKDYEQLSSRVFAEARPKTAIEAMLVDQIVGDIWRLKRVEQAERAYFEQIRTSALVRTLRSLSRQELQLIPSIIEGAKKTDAFATAGLFGKVELSGRTSGQPNAEGETPLCPEPDDSALRAVRSKLLAATDPDKLMLDGIVSADGDFPYSALDHIRRLLVREVLRNTVHLADLQDHRMMMGHARTEKI